MRIHYLKTAVRHLGRQPGYALLNILGLAVGMSGFMLILLFIHHELSYDRYHTNADRIYRVTLQNDAKTPPTLSPALRKEFPEVEDYVRLLAWPVAYFVMEAWLQRFAYRIDIEAGVFAIGGILALLIALLTISCQCIRTARANPVKASLSEFAEEKVL